MTETPEVRAAAERLIKMRQDSCDHDGGYPATPEGRLQSCIDHATLAEAYLAKLAKSPDSQRELREMFAANPVVADAVPPTRVRCWKSALEGRFFAKSNEIDGLYFSSSGRYFSSTSPDETIKFLEDNRTEITPAAALDLLKDWPEGRERFLQYCREHPPVENPKTVADALREMPVGTRFRFEKWSPVSYCTKTEDDVFTWEDGVIKWNSSMFGGKDANGPLVIIDPPSAEPVEQPAGVVVTLELADKIQQLIRELAKLQASFGCASAMSVEVFHELADARRKANHD